MQILLFYYLLDFLYIYRGGKISEMYTFPRTSKPTCQYKCTICPYFNKYKCKYFNIGLSDLMNAFKMLCHNITVIISLPFSYLTFRILFYSAMKYLSVCNLYIYIHLVKTYRHRSVTNIISQWF